jgi:hypothetical protein
MQVYQAWLHIGRCELREIEGQKMLVFDPAPPFAIEAFAQVPELYAEVAELKVTEKEVLSFAGRYGFPAEHGLIETASYMAFPFSLVRSEIKAFREVIRAWQVFGRHDPSTEEFIAYGMLERRINLAITRHVESRLEVVEGEAQIRPGSPSWWANFARLEFTTSAEGWLGAAWLQLALAVSDQKQIGRCEECGKLFELKPKRRFERRFCDKKCQMRNRRKSG